jgi:hypothetical protein
LVSRLFNDSTSTAQADVRMIMCNRFKSSHGHFNAKCGIHLEGMKQTAVRIASASANTHTWYLPNTLTAWKYSTLKSYMPKEFQEI